MREWSIKCSRNTGGVERLTNHTLLSGLSQHCSCSSVLQGADPLPYMQTTRSEALYSWTVQVAQHWTYRPITQCDNHYWQLGEQTQMAEELKILHTFQSSPGWVECMVFLMLCDKCDKKEEGKKTQTLILIKRHNQCIPNTVKEENI